MRNSTIAVLTLGHQLRSVHSLLFTDLCRDYEINNSALILLLYLRRNPETNTARDISRVSGIKSGLLSVNVDQLIRQNLIERQNDTVDRRVIRLSITKEGWQVLAKADEIQDRFDQKLREGISDEDFDHFIRIREQIRLNLSSMQSQMNKEHGDDSEDCPLFGHDSHQHDRNRKGTD